MQDLRSKHFANLLWTHMNIQNCFHHAHHHVNHIIALSHARPDLYRLCSQASYPGPANDKKLQTKPRKILNDLKLKLGIGL